MTNTHITQPQFAMIWFGAALSIAEIMTGTYLAPLGLTQGLYAIILGHIIGGILLFGAGLIGGRLRQGSMKHFRRLQIRWGSPKRRWQFE